MHPKVLIAVLHCDRKHHNRLVPVESICNQDYPNYEIYYNIESKHPETFHDLIAMTYPRCSKLWYDFWSYESNWWKKPEFDQDQARLVPIVRGRNDAIECALDVGAEYLLFVDSDMVIPKDTISRLIAHNKPMVGGYVPGRNDHKHVHYIFGNVGGIKDLGNGLKECDHGNIGFVLIRKDVFSTLKFRRGADRQRGNLQSDDPNYCFDALYNGFGRHIIDTNVVVQHVDETEIPFEDGAQF